MGQLVRRKAKHIKVSASYRTSSEGQANLAREVGCEAICNWLARIEEDLKATANQPAEGQRGVT